MGSKNGEFDSVGDPGKSGKHGSGNPRKAAVGVADNQFDFLHRGKLVHCSEYKTKFDCGVGGKFNALPLIFCPGKLSLCSGSRREILIKYEVPPWSKHTSIDSCAPMVSCHRALVSRRWKVPLVPLGLMFCSSWQMT